MSIEESGFKEAIVEEGDEEADWEECPCCGDTDWVRAIAVYERGTCWVLFCGGCGKPIQEKWNILP